MQRLELGVASDGESAATKLAAGCAAGDLPVELIPYSARFSPDGSLVAVGMENGALILYARDADSGAYVERWRRKAHKKEVKDVAFGAGGGLLCSVAPDYQCLAFALGPSGALTGEPSAVAQPSFRFYRENKYNKGKGAQWRCIAVGEPAGGGASPLLFGALNHVGGPGWVARCALNGGSCEAYSQVASSPLTALALAANGSHVAVGTSDGELIVLDARTLAQARRALSRAPSPPP
eukprot:3553151-Prymnesium_polylepis.2